MCGILGYVGETNEKIVSELLNQLRLLQSRGYDSCGMCSLSDSTKKKEFLCSKFVETKDESAWEQLEREGSKHEKNENFILHNRWATHGNKTVENAHPHIDFSRRISLVHNGIIENGEEWRSWLKQKGIPFQSQTDSEVVVNLIGYFYQQNQEQDSHHNKQHIRQAIQSTIPLLKGQWSLCIQCLDEPETLFSTCHGSPLGIGYETSGIWIASELIGFPARIQSYLWMNEDQLYISSKLPSSSPSSSTLGLGIQILDFKTNHIQDCPFLGLESSLPWLKLDSSQFGPTQLSFSPSPFSHWAHKEIYEQPDCFQRLLDSYVHSGGDTEISKIISLLENCQHVFFVACDSSFYTGMYGAWCLKQGKKNQFSPLEKKDDHDNHDLFPFTYQVIDAAEFSLEDLPSPYAKTLLFLISQSGETKEVLSVLDKISSCSSESSSGVIPVSLVNVEYSTLARKSSHKLFLKAGREVAVASTKFISSQMFLFHILTQYLSNSKSKSKPKPSGSITPFPSWFFDLPALTSTWLGSKEIQTCFQISEYLMKHPSCFVLGKGPLEALAKEGALKLKEIGYIHAEGQNSSSLKHGSFALLETGFPVILLLRHDEVYSKNLNVIQELSARNATVIILTDHSENLPLASFTVRIPSTQDFPFLFLLPLHIISYALALFKNINPDQPRNLAKAVTVE